MRTFVAAVEAGEMVLAQTQADLEACQAEPHAAFPATGQTTSYATGDDGTIQAGATLSYTDNGNGTITDNNTGLVWEKLCDEDPPGTTCPAEHDVDTTYTWTNAFGKITTLNTAPCFAGHCDWRLPNVKELQSIVNYQNFNPSVSSEFNTDCAASCSVTTCSCNAAGGCWSSTTLGVNPTNAWVVNFDVGLVVDVDKGGAQPVRAVRGGQ